jgi:hypothetical protein
MMVRKECSWRGGWGIDIDMMRAAETCRFDM